MLHTDITKLHNLSSFKIKSLNFPAASVDGVLVNIVQKYCIKGKNKPDWIMEQSAMKVHRLFAETVKRGCDNAAAGFSGKK